MEEIEITNNHYLGWEEIYARCFFCPNCKGDLFEKFKYCPECGNKLLWISK